MTLILGLESTCDDTCAAVVEDGMRVMSNVISSQEDLHRKYQGVVPEIASRAHLQEIIPVVELALAEADVELSGIDVIAVSNQPGLIGGLLVSSTTAKALSAWLDIPIIGINHIHAHLYAGIMSCPNWESPAIALTASGGHTLICQLDSPTSYSILGRTIDDAGGEAFDKGANLLGLSGLGGAALDTLAKEGNKKAVHFPRPLKNKQGYNFSFAGLKTALLYKLYGPGNKAPLNSTPPFSRSELADMAASFQEAICDVLSYKTFLACREFRAKTLFVTGGVAANSRLREMIIEKGKRSGVKTVFPKMNLCTDNAAMIAGLAYEYYKKGEFSNLEMEVSPRA